MTTNNTIAGLLADLRTLDESMAASLEAIKIAIDRINTRLDALETAIQGATDTSLHAARQADGVSKRMELHAEMFDALNERIAALEAKLYATP